MSEAPNTQQRPAPASTPPSFVGKWWTYQAERFPLFQHGPLILMFSASAVCYSRLLRGEDTLPGILALGVAFATCLIFFLQLRIADEFKDFDEDSRFRPYRAVPRGLVTLSELGVVFILGAVLQLLLSLWLSPKMIPLLLLPWIYLAAMSKEFFARQWLKGRPIIYMVSHMFIMPLIDLYATACDWRIEDGHAPSGLYWFLLASFTNGMVIEIGRKIRAPADEEVGVETYSSLWGRGAAIMTWLSMMAATAVLAGIAAWLAGIAWILPAPVAVLLLSIRAGRRFLRSQAPGSGRMIETMSGVWTLVLYLFLGVVPMLWIWWSAS
ncbi:MAG: UbiA family prenyltransferase [Phycisphaeraceae bacterium]|nr:UbiA family prenyltransferase [Phycisphaeraceae bacterium]